MNNNIVNKVDNHIKEMYRFNDPSIKSMLIEVKDSNIPMPVKVDLVTKLKQASDKISGKWTPASQLMRAPKFSTRHRKTSYRAKYSGNFSGGGAGTSKSTRQ
jgi:hypothetical protein|tara:strand:+ start:447 stop:752 length:306 start_codon:yes stop_codon:yes gene_type:complete